jgi:methionine synthase II (cobalamin-independent)
MSSCSHTNNDNINKIEANGLPTLIGSIPLKSHEEALDLIFHHTPTIPLWPQLPGIFFEGMLTQFTEGIPCAETSNEKTYFNKNKLDFEKDQLAFFEEYLKVSDDHSKLLDSRFSVSKERAAGIYLLLEKAPEKKDIVALKGQMTGPFTQLTGMTDQNKRAGYYDQDIREMVIKGLALKAAWQVTFLKQHKKPVILFIDEPALAGLGAASFLSISKEDIAEDQVEIINAIHAAGGLAGIHICANTDWPLILSLNYDIINFDAYGYFDRFSACAKEIQSFLDRGGIIAWGIIPTADEDSIKKEDTSSLVSLWEKQARQLVTETRDMRAILQQSLITPSCGTGSLTPELAKRVLLLTEEVSEQLRKKYL